MKRNSGVCGLASATMMTAPGPSIDVRTTRPFETERRAIRRAISRRNDPPQYDILLFLRFRSSDRGGCQRVPGGADRRVTSVYSAAAAEDLDHPRSLPAKRQWAWNQVQR